MKLGGNDNKINPQLGAVAAGSAAVLLLVLAIAVVPAIKKKNHHADFSNVNQSTYENSENASNPDDTASASQSNSPVVAEDTYSDSGITSPDELDFWDLYPADRESLTENVDVDLSGNGSGTGGGGTDKTDDTAGKDEEEEKDPAKDGKHTKVILRDGSEEWVTISSYLPRNDYDYTNLVCKDDRMEYYIDGKKVSYIGVDISKYQDYIDFNKVRKDGIDFVMIRVGARGYGTGQITLDEYFYENLKRATDVGLKVGVYFSSQAVNTDEAVEEAQLVIESLGEYKIDYPICFDMEFVDGDTARIETLSPNERTEIAKAFLDYVSGAGYTGCIYGDKEWLIKEIEMSKLTAYDFWLTQQEDLPDYPYKFSIWQYSTKFSVDGITGFVNLKISFVDYTEK